MGKLDEWLKHNSKAGLGEYAYLAVVWQLATVLHSELQDIQGRLEALELRCNFLGEAVSQVPRTELGTSDSTMLPRIDVNPKSHTYQYDNSATTRDREG